jgi:hypothetical protein
VATARPAMMAALATNVVKRRPRTKAKPSIVISAAGKGPACRREARYGARGPD